MNSARRSPNEAERLEALELYGLLDTFPDPTLDELTSLAAQICEAPFAFISLVDAERQWLKSKFGLASDEPEGEIAFCAHAVGHKELFIVPDASLDERFVEDPSVKGKPFLRFFAGAPLTTPTGHGIGALCVLDLVPRELNSLQREALRILSGQVMSQLVLRRQTRELAQNARLLRTIFDSEPDCVKVLGADGTLRMMNRAGLAIIEADSLGQIAGHCVYPLLVPEHREAFESLTQRVFRGETDTIEFQIKGLKGSKRWLETHAAPLRDEHGKVVSLLGITRDITEARRTAEALRRSREQLETIIQSIDGIVWEGDADTLQFTFVSPRAERLLGYPLSRWTDEPTFWVDHIHPDDREAAVAYCQKCTRERRDHELEYRMIASDGRAIWLRDIVTLVMVKDRPAKVCGIMVDVTDLKQADLALRESEAKFRALTEESLVGVYVLQDGRFRYANAAQGRILGFTPEELLNLPSATDYVADEDRARAIENIRRRVEGEAQVLRYEFTIVRKDGTRRLVEAVGSATTFGGKPAVLGTMQDITERKQAEERVRQLNRTLGMLSDINKLIVRERTPEKIVESACRIAVEKGGFTLAWIGFLEAPDRRLQLVGHAGANPESLEILGNMFADADGVCAFTTQALKTGTRAICNDLAHESKVDRRRTVALREGYNSMVALPLKVEGEVVGTFNLYSHQLEFFDSEELALLDELAADIGFALEIIRREAQRQHAEKARDVLLDLETELSGARVPIDVARCIFAAADKIWHWDAGALSVHLPDADLMEAILNYDIVGGERREVQLVNKVARTTPKFRRIMEEGAELVLRQPPFVPPPDAIMFGDTSRPSASLLSVPIRWRDRPVGVLSVQSYTPNAFTSEDLRTLQGLADHCGGTLERIRADAELRASEVRFRELAETIEEVFWIFEPARNEVLYVSPAYEKIWGRSCESLYGNPRSWPNALHPQDAARIRETVALQTEGSYNLEYRIVDANGGVRWIHDRAFPVRNSQGDIVRVVGTAEDITARRQLEEQLRQSQKMDAIGQLAGGVAHDFNNILATIMMQADMTAEMENLPPGAHEGLTEIALAAEKASSLTRQLLLFGRRQVMQSRDLNLNDVVTNVARMLQRIIGEDICLQLNLHPSPLMTRADPGMLDQVLLNLAVNARDAMTHGGKLTIETTEKFVGHDVASFNPEASPGRYACLSVSDTGMGISPEILPRIFDPFFTTKEPAKGTGLGLSTVFGIVKQHRGWIRVKSELGNGAMFGIFLPAISAVPKEPETKPVLPKPRGGTETILMAEDEPAVRAVTRILLERSGYRVIEAINGVEALKAWEAHGSSVSLLLTDMVMPDGLSGQQLARRLQQDNPNLKVIFTSGYSVEIAGRELDLRSGEYFIEKPFPAEQLLQTVRQCLDD